MYSRETSCLNDYNFETYMRIHKILETEDRCAVVQPTGTGKSYIMMELLKYFKDSWKIVIAPSRDFLQNMEQNKYWTSEKTLTLTYSFMGLNCDRIEEALAEYAINPDSVGLIIIDEMHRAGAPKWGAGVNNLISICKNAKTVGLTATPKRHDEDRDMVEELFNGKIAKNMNLAEAIQLGIIPQLSYVVGMHSVNTNLKELKANITDEKHNKYLIRLIDEYDKNWDFTNYFVKTLSKYIDTTVAEGKHIIFASSIEEAERMAVIVDSWFKRLFPNSQVNVYCIHSKNPRKSELVNEFFSENNNKEVKVAVAVNMLNESFHCKDIKTISMFRGTQSLNVYMQQIGRAISTNGCVPYIFDFVDNYHSIEALHEMLTVSNIVDMEDAYDTKSFVFKDFNDETVQFVKDVSRLRRLIKLHPDTILNEINNRLEKAKQLNEIDSMDAQHNILLNIPETDFVDWSSYALKEANFLKIKMNGPSKELEILDKLKISMDISRIFGVSWFNTFKNNLNGKLSSDDAIVKKMKSEFNRAFLLSSMSTETSEFLNKHGLSCNLIKNEEKLINLISKNEHKSFRYKDKLLMIPSILDENTNKFEVYKAIKKADEYFGGLTNRSWSRDGICDACCYWLWLLYKDKYKSEILDLESRFKDLMYIDSFMNTSKKNKQTIELGEVIKVNELISNIEKLDELSKDELYILDFHKVRKLERLYDCICKQLHLDVDEDNLKAKLKYQVTLDRIEDKFKDYAKSIKESAYSHMHLDNYTWCDAIMTRYNRLINICDAIINYVDNTDNSEFEWFNEYVKQSKEEFIYSKSKKSHLAFKYSANNKLALAYTNYSNIHDIEGELSNDLVADFRIEYDRAMVDWVENKYGSTDNTLFIGLIALARCKSLKENIGVNKISLRFQKTIITMFDWLINSENINYDREANTENIKAVYNMFNIIGEDVVYLAASAMSKKNRETYLYMLKTFLSTSKILSKNAAIFFEEATDRDNQLLYDIRASKLLSTFELFNNFNNKIYETYENI